MREDQACRNKVRHTNRQSAVRHRNWLIATTGAHQNRFTVYRCQFCGFHHVGTGRKPRKRKRW